MSPGTYESNPFRVLAPEPVSPETPSAPRPLQSERFPAILDSTALATFRNCRRKFYWSQIRKRRPAGTSIHLHAGAAFARGVQVVRQSFYNEGKDPETALALGLAALVRFYGTVEPLLEKHQNKDWLHTAAALESYFDHYQIGRDYLRPLNAAGKHAIEFSFALPIDIPHPDTGDPLIIAGRADMIALYRSQGYELPVIVDEKTCSRLGDTWPNQWELRAQMPCYAWAAREHGFPVTGAVIRGVCLYKAQPTGHMETIVYTEEWKINRWLQETTRNIKDAIAAYKEGYWSYNLADHCVTYGGCPFFELCKKRNPEPWIDVGYVEDTWTPLRGDAEEDSL